MARRFQVSVLNVFIHHEFVKFQNAINFLHKNQSFTDVTYLLLPSVGGKVDWHCIESASLSISKAKGQDHTHCFCPNGAAKLVQTIDGLKCRCMLQNSIVYTPHNGHFYYIASILDACNGNSSLVLKGGEHFTYKKYFMIRYFTHALTCQSVLLSLCAFSFIPIYSLTQAWP